MRSSAPATLYYTWYVCVSRCCGGVEWDYAYQHFGCGYYVRNYRRFDIYPSYNGTSPPPLRFSLSSTPPFPMLTYSKIVVGVTKSLSTHFSHGGIADRMIYLNGYPFLDNKTDHTFGVPVSQVMSTHITSLPARGMQLKHLERLVKENTFQGYPIVQDLEGKILVGYVGRTELRYAVERARKEIGVQGTTKCIFTSSGPEEVTPHGSSDSSSSPTLDLSRYIDPTPLTVHPRLPLETVMELFKKMGPRVILIEYRGRLTGLVTVKDCLKYQFKVEAGHAGGDAVGEEGMERVYGVLRSVAMWVDGLMGRARRKAGLGGRGGGELRLVSPITPARPARGEDRAFAVGDEDDDEDRGEDVEYSKNHFHCRPNVSAMSFVLSMDAMDALCARRPSFAFDMFAHVRYAF
jgi:CBS domain-containing protein